MIAEELHTYLLRHFPEQQVRDVRIGLGYTAVQLADGGVGVAYTFRNETASGCSVFKGKRPVAGRTTTEILKYLGAADVVEAAIGLAAANAMTNRPCTDCEQGEILTMLGLRPDDRVGMVGYFGPLINPLEQIVRELLIFERDTSRAESVLPAEQAVERLPTCDIAVISSSALIVGALDSLLEATRHCREVVLVGPSTPLVPSIFRPLGVTLLCGVTVNDPNEVLQVVSEGGGMGFFGKHVQKVNVRV